MTQNVLGLQKAFIRHWVCADARKSEREQKGEKIVVLEKLGRKDERERERKTQRDSGKRICFRYAVTPCRDDGSDRHPVDVTVQQ